MTQEQENAIIMLARDVIREFERLPRKDKKLDSVRKSVIDKHHRKLGGFISRAHFVHYIAVSNGIVSDE